MSEKAGRGGRGREERKGRVSGEGRGRREAEGGADRLESQFLSLSLRILMCSGVNQSLHK